MRTFRESISTLLLATSLLGLAACSDGNGRVSVKLTDAPGDTFEKAVVTISKVYLKGSVEAGSEADVEKGAIVLRDEPVTTDLLTLANDVADLVKDVEVPEGTYHELRFVISGGYIQVREDGASHVYATSTSYEGLPAGTHVDGELQMPSAASSGLKVKFDDDAVIEVSSDEDPKVLLVDFDVAQSFGRASGNSGRWVMGPVIKGADLQFSGNVKTTLTLGAGVQLPGTDVQLSGFTAVLVNADGSREPLPFTADANGVFVANFKYLLPGSYQVDVEAPAGVTFTTHPGHPASAMVGSGAETVVGLSLTAVAR